MIKAAMNLAGFTAASYVYLCVYFTLFDAYSIQNSIDG